MYHGDKPHCKVSSSSYRKRTEPSFHRIVHYEQRLKSLFYKKRFPERMGEVKPRVQGMWISFHASANMSY